MHTSGHLFLGKNHPQMYSKCVKRDIMYCKRDLQKRTITEENKYETCQTRQSPRKEMFWPPESPPMICLVWHVSYISFIWDTHICDSHICDTHISDTDIWDTDIWDTHIWDTHTWDTDIWEMSTVTNNLSRLTCLIFTFFTADSCRVSQCVAACCSVLQFVAVCRSVLQHVAVCCSLLQCVAVCCSVLQCVAVCCSVLQCIPVHCRGLIWHICGVLCTSALQQPSCNSVNLKTTGVILKSPLATLHSIHKLTEFWDFFFN